VTDGFKSALESTVEEGEQRLRRSMLMLLATGAVGGTFGYVDWLKAFGFAAFANMVGGIGL
jgi:hypothetical protein